METAQLSLARCIGATVPLCPPLSGSGSRAFSSSYYSSPSCSLITTTTNNISAARERPPSPFPISAHESLLSVGALWPSLCLPALAADQAVEITEAATQAVESAGAATESVESAGAAAQIVAEAGDGNLTITILGTAAFVGLILLTIAVAYLAITDFLEKRTRDEEAKKLTEESSNAKKKKSGSLTADRGGAKGFGKKLQDEE